MTTPRAVAPAALDLTGLTTLPAQAWGAVRLVPLVRDQPVVDLRLHRRVYGDGLGVVEVDRRTAYLSYIPHGFVAEWTGDGTPAAAYGTQLADDRATRPGAGRAPSASSPPTPACMPLHLHRRMARREEKSRLRFMPLHLALEGYLALHFGGPTLVWEQWSQQAVRAGLSPRVEAAYLGAQVDGLADALRVFEIHPGQCGVMVYVADALAAAFAVPHPEDYRVLHPTLLLDLYGELIHHYATLMPPVAHFRARIDDTRVRSLAELRAAVAQQEAQWADFHDATMADGLLGAAYTWQACYRMGRFTLSRFLPEFHPKQENHIGEAITDEHGRVAYLKTFRLSESQVRRGYLLSRLAAHDWSPAAAAAALGTTEARLGVRLAAAGFGFLLRQDVLDGYRKQTRVR